MSNVREEKVLGGCVINVKEIDREGVPVGIVEGYIATWDIDRGDWFGTKDQFIKGAFMESILDHQMRKRQIRLKDHNGRTVGGFPFETIKEDDRGLYGIGEINLEVQQGREAYSLAKQGVLTDFSIGFSIDESTTDDQSELRTIKKATIWEGSIVDEPMNPKANITVVKTIDKFQDLPIAAKETEWNRMSALENIWLLEVQSQQKAFIDVGEGVMPLLIADSIDGNITVVPKAIEEAVIRLKEETLNETSLKNAIKHLEKYYAKMDMPSPFEEEQKQFFNADEVKTFTARQFEKALTKSGSFSKEAAKFLVSKTNLKIEESEGKSAEEVENDIKFLSELNSLTELIKKK